MKSGSLININSIELKHHRRYENKYLAKQLSMSINVPNAYTYYYIDCILADLANRIFGNYNTILLRTFWCCIIFYLFVEKNIILIVA